MESLQADIARQVRKRNHVDSDPDFDAQMSAQGLLRARKQARHCSQPRIASSHIPMFSDGNVDVFVSPGTSTCDITVHQQTWEGSVETSHRQISNGVEGSNDKREERKRVPWSSKTGSLPRVLRDASTIAGYEEDDDDEEEQEESSSSSSSDSEDNDDDEDDSSDSDTDSEAVDKDKDNDSDNSSATSNVSTPANSTTRLNRSNPLHQLSRADFFTHLVGPLRSTPTMFSAKRHPDQRPMNNNTSPTVKSRLDALLPRMREANQELEVERREGKLGERNIEALDEEEGGYVEMNLGLGVLEEKKKQTQIGYEDEADTDEGEEQEESDGDEVRDRKLPALLPITKRGGKVGIEVLADAAEVA